MELDEIEEIKENQCISKKSKNFIDLVNIYLGVSYSLGGALVHLKSIRQK